MSHLRTSTVASAPNSERSRLSGQASRGGRQSSGNFVLVSGHGISSGKLSRAALSALSAPRVLFRRCSRRPPRVVIPPPGVVLEPPGVHAPAAAEEGTMASGSMTGRCRPVRRCWSEGATAGSGPAPSSSPSVSSQLARLDPAARWAADDTEELGAVPLLVSPSEWPLDSGGEDGVEAAREEAEAQSFEANSRAKPLALSKDSFFMAAFASGP
mmetsp:Transcript_26569/g.47109  ORF Transcript_26569/g.47109 Transcript_26569/m.47109 type:complete len:213 (+) Transcript_26569:2672-3310(+)